AHLGRVAEHRGGERAAQVHVETVPDAARIGLREAGKPGVDAALQVAALSHRLQRLRLRAHGEEERKREPTPAQASSPSSRNSRTSAIWSACSSVGAWP